MILDDHIDGAEDVNKHIWASKLNNNGKDQYPQYFKEIEEDDPISQYQKQMNKRLLRKNELFSKLI